MIRSGRFTIRLVAIVVMSAVLGCGDKKPKVVPVSGTVTFDGHPLAEGVMYFKTIQTGAFETFQVVDGKFNGTAMEGERRVEISAYQMKPVVIDGSKVDIPVNFIPTHYNLESTLTATVTVVGPNQFTFELLPK